jgi:16S rRNA processing protein RimM
VRGEVKIKSFTADPRKIAAYGPVEDESGSRQFKVKVRGLAGGLVIARLEGVEDRNAAEALKGMRLYVGRDKLPRPKRGEWYQADLIGLRAERVDGTAMGTVKSVQNYGAGDIVEVETAPGQTVFVPFTKRVVPDVDIDGGRIVIDPPAETEAKADETDEASEAQDR